ncbi:hypothetical protein [Rubrobacter tropicus]|uniref:hypothetical protein n=1 Tax=Rubrobacter tropicus TaxID=2653851 RepID=UPI001409419B|nr:hypothetical protein [Rubrobacter tropicus]
MVENPDRFAGSLALPGAGMMLAHTGGGVNAAEYDARAGEGAPGTLYRRRRI